MTLARTRASSRFIVLSVLLYAAACSPALDWREVRPADSGAALLLPCKPAAQVRAVRLAGQAVRLALHACSAGGQTWALAFAELGDPARVGPALIELRASAAANLGAVAEQTLPLKIPGATPNPASQRALLSGRLPDGQAMQEQMAVFTRGTMVYQATVLGQTLADEAAEIFFSSLRAGS